MPESYPAAPFTSFSDSFLKAYTVFADRKRQREQDRIDKRQAQSAENLRQADLSDRGYTEQKMPTIEQPPALTFEQSVGQHIRQFFSGGPEEPGTFLVKDHPSAADAAVARSEAFTTGRDTARYASEREIAQMGDTAAASRNQNTINAENTRATARNATDVQVAGLNHEIQARALFQGQRDKFFTDAVAAAGGDPVQAMKNVEQFQMPQARKFGATRTDYHAAAARYRDSKAMLTREGYQTREDIADKKGSATEDLRARLTDPAYSLSDADAWEYYVSHGSTNEQATAKVQARKRGGTMLPRDLNGQPVLPPPPAATGGKPGNIVLPANPSPRTSNATPNAVAPTSAFPPEQEQAIGTLAAGIRAGHATLDQLRGQVPDAVYSAVVKLRALTAAEKSQANKDPQFKGWLLHNGYTQQELGS